jgi:hypothetical protein
LVSESIRVCVCGPDEELRAWIAEELALMTWLGSVQLESSASLLDEPQAYQLVIAGLDGASDEEVDRLAARNWTTPLIAIGSRSVPAHRVLGTRLTSRELKQAIRELIVR